MRGALCVATRLYILYVAADESTSGWEFYCLFLNPHKVHKPTPFLLPTPLICCFWFWLIVLGVSRHFGSFNAKLSHFDESWYVSRFLYFHIFQLNVKTVLFQTIQFSMSTVFLFTWLNVKTINFKQFSLALFDPLIGPDQVLPLWDRVDQGVMAIKWYSAFPKAPAILKLHHQIV